MRLFIHGRPASRSEVLDAAANYLASDIRGKRVTITGPRRSRSILEGILQGHEREHFWVVYLDIRHRVIETERMFSGTVDGSAVYIREIVKRALALNAVAIICAHNHPSGVPDPSESDIQITRRIAKAVEIFEIKLLDHIVVGSGSTVSFAEQGLL